MSLVFFAVTNPDAVIDCIVGKDEVRKYPPTTLSKHTKESMKGMTQPDS